MPSATPIVRLAIVRAVSIAALLSTSLMMMAPSFAQQPPQAQAAGSIPPDPEGFVKAAATTPDGLQRAIQSFATDFAYPTTSARDLDGVTGFLTAVVGAAKTLDDAAGTTTQQSSIGVGLARGCKLIMASSNLATLKADQRLNTQAFCGSIQTFVAGLGKESPVDVAYVSEDGSQAIASVDGPSASGSGPTAVFGTSDGKAGVVISNNTPSGAANRGLADPPSLGTATRAPSIGFQGPISTQPSLTTGSTSTSGTVID